MTRISVLLACLMLPQLAFANPFSDARGTWMRNDGNARVRVAPCGETLCATNLWIRDTSMGEEVGDRLVMNLKPTSSATLEGTAYDPKRKLSYSMTLRLDGKSLMTRGCVVGGLICKDVRWTAAD